MPEDLILTEAGDNIATEDNVDLLVREIGSDQRMVAIRVMTQSGGMIGSRME